MKEHDLYTRMLNSFYKLDGEWVQRSGLINTVYTPLSTNGDAIYLKDVDFDNSDFSGWSGDPKSLFFSPFDEGLSNDSSDNPKVIEVAFKRTVKAMQVGLGDNNGVGFRGLRLVLVGSGDDERAVIDEVDCSDNCFSRNVEFENELFNKIRLEFHTDDPVSLTNLTIQRGSYNVSQIQGYNEFSDSFKNVVVGKDGALITGLQDSETGSRSEVDILGNLKTTKSVRLVGTSFNGTTKDAVFWEEVVEKGGSISQAGEIQMRTGTSAGGYARYTSRDVARKVTGTINQFRAAARLTTEPDVDCVRRIGSYNVAEDNLVGCGFFFELDGLDFNIVTSKAGVRTVIPMSDWNGNLPDDFELGLVPRRYTIDISELRVDFFLDDLLVHTYTSDEAICITLNLPITFECFNKNGSEANNGFDVRFASIVRNGDLFTQARTEYLSGNESVLLKANTGFLQSVINLNNQGSLLIYDGLDATGELIADIDAGKVLGDITLGAQFNRGLFVVSGANTRVVVRYE